MSPDVPAMTDDELADALTVRDLLLVLAEENHRDRSSIYGEQCSCGGNDRPCPDEATVRNAASFMTALLIEVERARMRELYMHEQIEQLAQVAEERKAREVVYRALAEEHQKRGDKLSAQLAEIGETKVEYSFGDVEIGPVTAARYASAADAERNKTAASWSPIARVVGKHWHGVEPGREL